MGWDGEGVGGGGGMGKGGWEEKWGWDEELKENRRLWDVVRKMLG